MRVGQAFILAGTLVTSATLMHPPAGTTAAVQDDHSAEIVDCNDESDTIAAEEPQEKETRGRDDAMVRRLTPALITDVFEVLDEINPARAKAWRQRHKSEPERFTAALARDGRRIIALAELKNRDPKLYEFKLEVLKVDSEVERTANRIKTRRENGLDTKKLEAELNELLIRQVAFSIAVRSQYLKRLEKHLEELKQDINDQAQSLFAEVDRRKAELLDDKAVATRD
jgi:hypothetical protein